MDFKPYKVIKTKKGTYRKRHVMDASDKLCLFFVVLIVGFVLCRSLIG